MSVTIFKKAFGLEFSHDFFDVANRFSILRYLEFVPVSGTAKLFRDGRMRMVATPKGFDVFYQAYLDTVPVTPVERPMTELTGPVEFLFEVRIKEAQDFFQNVTDLNIYSTPPVITKKYKAGMKYMLKGDPSGLSLSPSLIDQVRPQVFTYTFRGKEIVTPFSDYSGTVNISVKDEQNTTVFSFTNVASDPQTGVYSLPLDFSDKENGIYSITATKTAGGAVVHESQVYVSNELAPQNFFGLVRMKYATTAQLYNGSETYVYALPNRKVRWRYYVSVKDYPSGFFTSNYLEISDTLAAYTFTPFNSPGIPHPSFKVNGLNTVVFTSTGGGVFGDGRIPFTQTAIKSFRLRQLGTVTKTIVPVLGNAAVTGTDSNRLNSPSADVPPYAEIFLTIDTLTTT